MDCTLQRSAKCAFELYTLASFNHLSSVYTGGLMNVYSILNGHHIAMASLPGGRLLDRGGPAGSCPKRRVFYTTLVWFIWSSCTSASHYKRDSSVASLDSSPGHTHLNRTHTHTAYVHKRVFTVSEHLRADKSRRTPSSPESSPYVLSIGCQRQFCTGVFESVGWVGCRAFANGATSYDFPPVKLTQLGAPLTANRPVSACLILGCSTTDPYLIVNSNTQVQKPHGSLLARRARMWCVQRTFAREHLHSPPFNTPPTTHPSVLSLN